jgi:hypothetical protein
VAGDSSSQPEAAHIDALIALVMAGERAAQPLPTVKFHGSSRPLTIPRATDQGGRMPTSIVVTGRTGGQFTVAESVEDVTNAINGALTSGLKFVTFTDAGANKAFSVEAAHVRDIKEA